MWKNVIRTIDNYFPYFAILVMMALLAVVLYQTFGPVNAMREGEFKAPANTPEAEDVTATDSIIDDSAGYETESTTGEDAGEITE